VDLPKVDKKFKFVHKANADGLVSVNGQAIVLVVTKRKNTCLMRVF
jgi:hypothetical protein